MEDIVTSLAKEDIKLLDNEELLKQMAHFVVVKRKTEIIHTRMIGRISTMML